MQDTQEPKNAMDPLFSPTASDRSSGERANEVPWDSGFGNSNTFSELKLQKKEGMDKKIYSQHFSKSSSLKKKKVWKYRVNIPSGPRNQKLKKKTWTKELEGENEKHTLASTEQKPEDDRQHKQDAAHREKSMRHERRKAFGQKRVVLVYWSSINVWRTWTKERKSTMAINGESEV